MEFETRKLFIKKFIPEYLDIMYETWGTDKEVGRYIPGFRIDWDINDFSEYVLKTYQDNNHTRYIIQEKSSNDIIGNISLYQEDSSSKSIMIWLITSAWNKGYGEEAFKAIVKEYKKKSYNLNSLYATCDKRNEAMVKILESCGFELIDEIKDSRTDIDGVLGTELLYELQLKK